MRQLAALAETDPGYVSRLLDLFEREELVRRNQRGSVEEVDVPGLIRRWATEYRFVEANRAVLCHDIGGPRALLCRLRESDIPYAVTGRASAAVLAHQSLPNVVACYVDNPERAARRRICRRCATGNVVLLEPFDAVVFAETWERDGFRHAAPSQLPPTCLAAPRPARRKLRCC